MATLEPLAMSQTKDDLLKHLNMRAETYIMMAKEADKVYKWLTSEKRHLKKNCKRKPPYDWSDIVEKSKDEAMEAIAQSGDEHTSYYWNLATPTDDCPNWIARWFLYHKFRYRDGRNRNSSKTDEPKHSHHTSKHSHYGHSSSSVQDTTGYYAAQAPDYPTGSMTSAASNEYVATYANTPDGYSQNSQDPAQSSTTYYDPVRDVTHNA